MESNSLSYQTLKNVSYGFAGYAAPILFSIFITPVVVHKLGVVDYGVYLLMQTMLALIGLIDLGLSSSLIKYISEYFAKKNFVSLKKLLDSANALYLIIGVLGLLAFVIIAKFFLHLFNLSPSHIQHIFPVAVLAGLIFFVNSVNSVYTVVPLALQRFDISTRLNLIQLMIVNLGMLILVLFDFGLKAIFSAHLFVIVIASFYFRFYFKKLLPEISLGISWDKRQIAQSYKFGFMAAVANLSIQSLAQLGRLVIPVFIGPAALTFYSLPGNVAQKTSGITASLTSVLFPMTSGFSGAEQLQKIQEIYKRSFRNIVIITAALTTAIIAFSYEILFYWLGEEFAVKGSLILVIFAAAYFFISLFNLLVNFLFGMNKVKFLSFSSLGLAGLNLLFIVLLVPKYGIQGAAWAFLLSVLPVVLIFYYSEKYIFCFEKVFKGYFSLFAKVFFTAVTCGLALKFVVLKGVYNLPSLLILGPLSVLLYLILYKLFGFFEQEDWLVFKAFGSKVYQRINRIFI